MNLKDKLADPKRMMSGHVAVIPSAVTAQAMAVSCADFLVFDREHGPVGPEILHAMIAATHTALAAEALGLSSCFMNGWLEDKVKAVIGAADQPNLEIALLLPIGYGAEPRKNPGRLPLSVNVSVDRLGQPYGG